MPQFIPDKAGDSLEAEEVSQVGYRTLDLDHPVHITKQCYCTEYITKGGSQMGMGMARGSARRCLG